MLRRRETGDGVVWYESPLLAAAGVPHAFSTRVGGVSTGPFASLNMGNPTGCDLQDARENIRENERRLLRATGWRDGSEFCRVHQVHGDAVATVRAGAAHDPHAKADAIVTSDPARVVSVRVADCVPVLLASGDGSVVAAVHAGWRGVTSGVVLRAMEAMGTSDIIAAIGPSIDIDAFEVGPEVVDEFERAFSGARESLGFIRTGKPGKWHIDLRAAIAAQLSGAGVQHIDTTDRCTFRDAEEFYSHRREMGLTGRMVAIVSPRATPRTHSTTPTTIPHLRVGASR